MTFQLFHNNATLVAFDDKGMPIKVLVKPYNRFKKLRVKTKAQLYMRFYYDANNTDRVTHLKIIHRYGATINHHWYKQVWDNLEVCTYQDSNGNWWDKEICSYPNPFEIPLTYREEVNYYRIKHKGYRPSITTAGDK